MAKRLTPRQKQLNRQAKRLEELLIELGGKGFLRNEWKKLSPAQRVKHLEEAIFLTKKQKEDKETEQARNRQHDLEHAPEEPDLEQPEENEVDAFGEKLISEDEIGNYDRTDYRKSATTLSEAINYQREFPLSTSNGKTTSVPPTAIYRDKSGYYFVLIDYERTVEGKIYHKKDRHKRKGGDRHTNKNRKRSRGKAA